MDRDQSQLQLLYEGMRKRLVSKVVIISNSRILLLQKNGSLKWELPGGHLEPKESFKQAAKREVREETRLVIDKSRLEKVDKTKDGEYIQVVYKYHLAGKDTVKISDEHVDYRWVSQPELDKLSLTSSTNHLAIVSSYN